MQFCVVFLLLKPIKRGLMYSRERRGRLTGEAVNRLFKNSFELANYAISLAHHHIRGGHEVLADEMLEEVRRYPDPIHLQELREQKDGVDSEDE